MKKYFKLNIIITISIYLIISFIRWDIAWITQIPQYETSTRGLMMFCYLLKEFILLAIITKGFEKKLSEI